MPGATHIDEAVVLLHHAMNDGKAQSRTGILTRPLLAEEGLEDVTDLLCFDATAIVGNR
jgi:hypothetical protein